MLLVLLEAYLAILGLDHDTFRRIRIEVRERPRPGAVDVAGVDGGR